MVDNDQIGACAKIRKRSLPAGLWGGGAGVVAGVVDDGGDGAGVESVMVTWMVTWCMFFL